MTEETANTSVQGGQKPEWQTKADEMEKQVGNGLFVQLAYRSDLQHNCEPVLLSEKQVANIYPIVVDVPAGLIDPKFDWGKGTWIENSVSGMATKLATLSADVDKIKDYQRDDQKAKQINQQKDTETLKLMSMVTGELGKLSVKVDKLLAAQPKPAENMQQSQPTAVTEKEGE